jgi:hypothetical protein
MHYVKGNHGGQVASAKHGGRMLAPISFSARRAKLFNGRRTARGVACVFIF